MSETQTPPPAPGRMSTAYEPFLRVADATIPRVNGRPAFYFDLTWVFTPARGAK